MSRYIKLEGSHTGTPPFEFSVIDTEFRFDGTPIPAELLPKGKLICECIEESDADLIVAALNHYDREIPDHGSHK